MSLRVMTRGKNGTENATFNKTAEWIMSRTSASTNDNVVGVRFLNAERFAR
jgi:hypothetical protein